MRVSSKYEGLRSILRAFEQESPELHPRVKMTRKRISFGESTACAGIRGMVRAAAWLAIAAGLYPLASTLDAQTPARATAKAAAKSQPQIATVPQMTARVSEEAAAFEKLAPAVLGKETFHQRAIGAPTRFHPRVGSAAMVPPAPKWKQHEVVSQYGFTSFSNDASALHEIRQVTSVDAKKVEDEKKAQDALAQAITANDDERKRMILKKFEKYGLAGAATDFGQLLLLFSRRNLERYEFLTPSAQTLDGVRVLVYPYKQLDGPEVLTLFGSTQKDEVRRLRVSGEIWVRQDNLTPVRITLTANEGDSSKGIREEATVDYAMSRFGAVLPTQTVHQEFRDGNLTTENKFVYSDFHKFGASSDIQFQVAQ